MELSAQKKVQEGINFHKKGRLKKAEVLYRNALKINPNHPDANHNLGILSISKNKSQDALNFFKVALEANPKMEQFWASYIDTLIRDKQLDKARKLINEGKELGFPLENENLNRIAIEFHKLGRLDDAEITLRDLIKVKPLLADAHNNLGITLQELGRLREAEVSFRQAINLDPKFAKAFYNIGNLLKISGKLEKAETIFRHVIILDPKFHQAFNNLGSTLLALNKLEDAQTVLMQLLKFKSNYPEAYLNLGITYYRLGNLSDAEINLRQAINYKPDFVQAYNDLGLTLKKIGKLTDAEASFRKAIALDPQFTSARNNLGVTLQNLGKLRQAEALFRELILINSEIPEFHNNLGLTFYDLGKFKDSEESFKKAIILNSSFASAYNNLGITLRKLQKPKEAEINFRKAITLEEDFAGAHNNLANVLKEFGNLEDAENSYETAIALKHDYREAMLNLSSAYDYMNDYVKAVNILEKLFKSNLDNYGLRAGIALSIFSFLKTDFVKSREYLIGSSKINSDLSSKSKNEKIYYGYLSKILDWHNKSLNKKNNRNDKKLYVVGESHSLVAHSLSVKFANIDFLCEAKLIMGCKQWHLGNPNKNQYQRKFEIIFDDIPKNSHILLTIGEIDCRINDGILKHKKKKSLNYVKPLIHSTIENYINYVCKINSVYKHNIIIQGVPCPNIREDDISKEERSELIKLIRSFNSLLKTKAKENKFGFLDVGKLTDRGDGYSNKIWHIDEIHLSPEGMLQSWNNYKD